jgi:NDP-sugar pyrophosphorylase family protein
LLDTGGGLKKAAWFFQEDYTSRNEPFILHNVDVISTIDLVKMVEAHEANDALATLAVHKRESSRQLLFDEHLQLCGRRAGRDREPEIVLAAPNLEPLAFSGVHIISPRLFPLMKEDGIFSIVTSYLRLAGQGEKISGFRADEYYWRDLGRVEDLSQAAQDLEQKVIP